MKKIQYFLLLVFFIANSAYRLGTGFDAILVRGSFFGLLACTLIFNRKIKINPVLKWGILFWSYYFLSMLWARDSSDTLHHLNVSIQILGVFIFLPNIIDNKNDIKKVLKLLIYSSAYAMVLLAIRTPISLYGTERIGEVIGQNPNSFGMIMAVSAILSIYFVQIDKEKLKKSNKIMLTILLFLFCIFSLLSGSKKALLLLIGGIIALELFATRKTKKFKGVLLVSIFVPITLFLIFNNKTLYSVLGYRLERTYLTITNQSTRFTTDSSLVERRFYKEQAIYLFKKYPFIGVGGNNFSTYMRYINYKHIAYSHNNYVELLATLGIVGFIIYYIFFLKIIINLIRFIKNDVDKELSIMFLIILIIFLILDYGLVSFCEIFNAIILAIIDCYIHMVKRDEKND